MNVTAIKTRVFKEGESLLDFIVEHVPTFGNRSILAVTSKIVALAEGRTAALSEEESVIRSESEWQKETKYGSLTFKDDLYMWNAGIDSSNANGKIVLLPRDSYAAAQSLRSSILQNAKITEFGIVITVSRIMPLRSSVFVIALGYAGFKGLRDYRGKPDIFDRPLAYTQTDVADALATTAILEMGEGSEQQPLCLIEDAPVEFTDETNRAELIVPPEEDMYGPLFRMD